MPSGSGSSGGGSKGSPAKKRSTTAAGSDFQTTNPNAPNYSPF